MDISLYTDFRAQPAAPPTAHDLDETISTIKEAERLGFHGVWTTEQHGVDDGYLPAQLPALAALSRETERLRLGSGVILLPLTHPRRVVEEACFVDALSHGRLTLGLGAGNYPNEFRIYGVPMSDRARRMEEGVSFVREALSGAMPPDGAPINIPPVQKPVPLVLGGLVERAVDRAVRLADGHMAYAYLDPDRELPNLYQRRIAPCLERRGRSPDGFRLVFTSILWVSDDAEHEWREIVGPAVVYQQRRYQEWEGEVATAGGYAFSGDIDALRKSVLVGSAPEIAERLLTIHERYPFSEVVLWMRFPGMPMSLVREHLHRVAEELRPLLST